MLRGPLLRGAGQPLPVQAIGELSELVHLDHLPLLAGGLSCVAARAGSIS